MNEYFLIVFTQENMQGIPDNEQISETEDSEKLTDLSVTKEMVKQKMERLKVQITRTR